MTACGGNFIDFILNRKGALPRAVRESRDYDSAVRVRFLAPQCGVTTIEVAVRKSSTAHCGRVTTPPDPGFYQDPGAFYSPAHSFD